MSESTALIATLRADLRKFLFRYLKLFLLGRIPAVQVSPAPSSCLPPNFTFLHGILRVNLALATQPFEQFTSTTYNSFLTFSHLLPASISSVNWLAVPGGCHRLNFDPKPLRVRYCDPRSSRRRIETRRVQYIPEMTETDPPCPECRSDFTYELGGFRVCSMCAHEWVPGEPTTEEAGAEPEIRDSVGNVLRDGDTVTVIRNLKMKGSSSQIKVGTKVRNIRLVDGVGDHDIDCRIDGFGAMQLKSSVVKKA